MKIIFLCLVITNICQLYGHIMSQGGYSGFQVTGMIDGFLGFGLKFSISGFFWVVKFWLVFFGVAWFKQGFFGKFNTYVSVFHVISFNAFWKFLWLGNLASCWHGIFLGFVGRPRDFFGFDFCPHSIIPVTWNSEYPLGHQVLNC